MRDPRDQYPKPPFEKVHADYPAPEAAVQHPPVDHGEATYRGSNRLAGKKAVVTGGDSGIGRAIAIAFAREGADVLISYVPEVEEDDAQATVRSIEEADRHGYAVAVDLRDEQACRDLIERAERDLGRIDILVNNAGYAAAVGSVAEITTEQFDRTMKTNVYATFWLSKEALPRMQPGATIINTASVAAYKAEPAQLDYSASKAAIVAITKALASEAIKSGIRVNAVAPGPVWTPLVAGTLPPEEIEQWGGEVPIARPAQPAELAPAYVFLASQESSYVSGAILPVTGGTPIA